MGFFDSLKNIFSSDKDTSSDQEETPRDKQADYIATIEAHRASIDQHFRSSSYSPMENRAKFKGLNYYPPDPELRLTLPLQAVDKPELLDFQTSTGETQTYYRIGIITFEIDGETAQLALYKSKMHDQFFLPFRDATSGQESYGAGRYLEPVALANNQVLVDFNLAYNPYCAYSDNYSCPLPPFENHLKIPIRAGEKKYMG